MSQLSRKGKWAIGSSIALVAVLLMALIIYSFYFSNRALPRTSVAGLSVSGQTAEELSQTISEKAAATTVTLEVDGEQKAATLDELGYTVDVDATVDQALAGNRSILQRFLAPFSATVVVPVVETSAEKTEAYADSLLAEGESKGTNATVVLNEAKDSFVVTASQPGKTVESEEISAAATLAAEQLSPTSATVRIVDIDPKITTEQATAVAEKANQMLALNVSLSDGVENYTADVSQKASWITIKSSAETISDPTFDDAKVNEWVESVANSTNEDPVKGIRNINSRGDVVSVVQQGSSGWKVKNSGDVAKSLVSSLDQMKDYHGNFDYEEVTEDKWEEVLIADGAENLAYQAAPNEKWIDINLSSYTVTAYEGATVVRGPVYMVPGAPQTPTATGTFKVYLKYATQTMRGDNVDGTKYETEDVPWVTYFTGSYALHGAYWRSSFGYGGSAGSHGCVNMPVDEAKWFYDWSEIGTTVASHY